MEEKFGAKTNSNEILEKYVRTFNTVELPYIPMFQCMSYDDEQYIAMLENAINRGTPVNDKDYEKYFPMQKGVLY